MGNIKMKKKICAGCKKETYLFSHGLCKQCATKNYSIPKGKGKLKKVKKVNNDYGYYNQMDLFSYLWDKSNKTCWLSGESLKKFEGTDRWHWMFAHILNKGVYTLWKLNPKNIVIIHPDAHHLFDHGTIEQQDKSRFNFTKLRLLKEQLKREYYETTN